MCIIFVDFLEQAVALLRGFRITQKHGSHGMERLVQVGMQREPLIRRRRFLDHRIEVARIPRGVHKL